MNVADTHRLPQSTPAWPTPTEEPSERECLPGETPTEEEVPFVTPPQMPWPRILPGL